jgi:hypothetical protein
MSGLVLSGTDSDDSVGALLASIHAQSVVELGRKRKCVGNEVPVWTAVPCSIELGQSLMGLEVLCLQESTLKMSKI